MRIRATPTAKLQLDALAAWWRLERRKARPLKTLFREAVARIRAAPKGRPDHLVIDGVLFRRMAIRTTPYHVYYTVREKDVVIAAVWSGEVEHGPPLDLDEIDELR